MTKLVLPFLETMITQACNLSCHGCTNYSDLKHSGYVSWKEGKQSLEQWLQVIDIPDFGIIGGEPLINPEVTEWLTGVRQLMPHAQIRFTTNGELLHKYPDLIKLCHDLGNMVFKISVHRHNTKTEEAISKILESYNWQPITEYGIHRFVTSNNFKFQVNRPQVFVKTYKNNYANMKPWGSNPDESFNVCIQQTCPLMYRNRIYKCSTQGLLADTLQFLNITDGEWDQYKNFGIGLDSSYSEIETFVNNFGKPAPVCSMCPSKYHTDSMIFHYNNVKSKNAQN